MNFTFPIITLPAAASAHERGRMYGLAAAPQIRHSVLTYAK